MAHRMTVGSNTQKPPKVFIFDFDGIITDLKVDWSRVRGEINERLGIKVTSILDFFEKSWQTPEFQTVSSLVEEFEMQAAAAAQPFEDVKPTLEYLKGSGTRCYVASMQSIRAVEFFEKKYDIMQFFRKSLGREDGGSKKGELQIIASIESEVSKNRIVFIDDNKKHMEPCKELGMNCFLFNRLRDKKTLNEVVKGLTSSN